MELPTMEEPAKFSNWIDSYNSSWTREDLYLVLSVGGTEYLYEKLAANGELDSTSPIMAKFRSARKSTRWRNIHEKSSLVNLMPRTLSIDSGFHFKERVDERDFEAMTSGMLELQVKDAKLVLNQCEIVSLISQKVLVFNRLSHAFRYFWHFLTRYSYVDYNYLHSRAIYQRKSKNTRDDPHPTSTRGSLSSIDDHDRERVGTQALVELGLTTGLSLVFALLRQNWQMQQQNPGSNILCNEVLKTALRVLSSLPIMSLANANNDIGQTTLNQVNEFLIQSMNPESIGNDVEGSVLSAEVLLLLAVQRGKLSMILEWIYSAFEASKTSKLYLSSEVARLAVHHIRSVGSGGGKDFFKTMQSTHMDIGEVAKILLQVIVEQSQHSQASNSSRNSTRMPKNEAFLWGSNSSHQLAEGSHEKILGPKQTSAFHDVLRMEAGQYCTFVVHESGHVSAVGKGSYGRLGLGDSTNQSIPRRLCISTPVKAVSSSKGSSSLLTRLNFVADFLYIKGAMVTLWPLLKKVTCFLGAMETMASWDMGMQLRRNLRNKSWVPWEERKSFKFRLDIDTPLLSQAMGTFTHGVKAILVGLVMATASFDLFPLSSKTSLLVR